MSRYLVEYITAEGGVLFRRNHLLVDMQGYGNDKAMIVAQNPMESTAEDFWRMIVDEQVAAIVMLCSPEEEQRVSDTSCYIVIAGTLFILFPSVS